MTQPRVYVHGVGAVSSLAPTWRASVEALADGDGAIRRVERFDTTGYPCQVGAEVAVAASDDDRCTTFASLAAAEAWDEASLSVPADRLGVFVGVESGRGTHAQTLAMVQAAGGGAEINHARFGRDARRLTAALAPRHTSPARVPSRLAAQVGASGPVEAVSLACASGAAAIAEAVRAIRVGECDVALAGGVGADLDAVIVAGFCLLGALSVRGVSRPFDVERDGFVIGEGAAMFVLAAQKEGAVAEVAGIGRSLDAHHLTAPDPSGRGAERSMRAAMADAQVDVVDAVQAHGTSTDLNDAAEATALARVLGARIVDSRVSSVKGALGHWIAGAGALGLACAVDAVRHQRVLPTVGLATPDPRLPLPHVLGMATPHRVRAAMSNAFAFGGANVSLVVREVPR